MSGPQKAALIIALAVVALVAFNWALWRRMRAVLRDAKARAGAADGSSPAHGRDE